MLNTSDLIPVGLTGNVTIQSKAAQFTKTIVADGTFEGTEKFVAKLRKGSVTGNVVASTGVVTIFDTSVSSPLPTYSLAANKTSSDEGSNINIVLTTTNVSAGSTVPYTITGVASSDIDGASLSGRFTVSSAGTASLTLNITADNLTEGIETLTLSLNTINPTVSVSVVINDTSESPVLAPTYILSVNASTVNEGGSVTFTLATTNLLRGTQVPYTITGVSTADIGTPLTGNFIIGSTGTASLALSIVNDSVTEGAETLTVTLDGITPAVSQSVSIIDTSLSPNTPTYRLTSSVPSINEGNTVTVTLTTTNVANGTSVPYAITGTGISGADFGGALLTGNFTVLNNTAVISLPVAADGTDEGPESFTVTLTGITPTVSAVVTINDTSKTPLPASYALGASAAKINEGDRVTITLTTTNVSAGTQVPYTITGISSSDIGGASLTGNFTVTASGTAQATLSLNADADQLTEGLETLRLTLDGITPAVSVSVQIEDTSKAPVASYALSCSIADRPLINTAQQITINGYHKQFLGRNATPSEITYWDTNVTSGIFTLSQVSTSIRNSAEAATWDGTLTAIENNDLITITLVTSNVPSGTLVPFTVTGVAPGDFIDQNGPATLTRNFVVGPDGKAYTSYVTNPDRLTEGVEIATVTLDNISPAVTTKFRIFDSSSAPTYALTSNINAANEGASVTITLTTTNVLNGTTVPFTLSGTGINSTDLTAAGLTWNAGANRFDGSFTVNNDTASIVINLTSDRNTEGAETFNVTLSAITPTVTKSITINDTSITQTGTGTAIVPGVSGVIANMPADPVWVAFRMIGAGGSGAATDGGGSSQLGYSLVTDGAYSPDLNTSAIKTGTNPFTLTVGIWIPTAGAHSFIFSTDNSGTFSIDGTQYGNWNDYRTNQTGVIPMLTAGGHSLTVTGRDLGGQFGIGLKLFGPDGRQVFNTWQVAASGGGSGGPGTLIEGVVQLPATSGPKVLRGGAGAPGRGGARYSNAGGGQESGGVGFGPATVSGAVIVNSSTGTGGKGGRAGPAGSSGQGGAGGGASNLYYVVGEGTSSPVATNIAIAAGGGGGGGKANNNNWAQHAQLISGLNLAPQTDGQDAPGDGSGGGGGGGGFVKGSGGRNGVDSGQTSSGGDVGTSYRNTSLTWNTWNEYIERINGTVFLPGSTFSNSKLTGSYPLGKAGTGVLTAGSWSAGVATGGVQGGISVYWTTSPTAPDLTSIPQFGDASALVTVSMPPTQDSPSGITFRGDGTCAIGGTTKTWVTGASLPGIGEWYDIKFVSGNPSNGQTKGPYTSTVPENTWFVPTGNGDTGYSVTPGDNYIDVTVTIRRRTNGAIVGTVVYKNIGNGAPIDYSGDLGGSY